MLLHVKLQLFLCSTYFFKKLFIKKWHVKLQWFLTSFEANLRSERYSHVFLLCTSAPPTQQGSAGICPRSWAPFGGGVQRRVLIRKSARCIVPAKDLTGRGQRSSQVETGQNYLLLYTLFSLLADERTMHKDSLHACVGALNCSPFDELQQQQQP